MLNLKNIEAIFNASTTPSLILLPDAPFYTVVHVNKAFTHLTDLQDSHIVGKGIFTFFSQQADRAELTENLSISLQKVHSSKVAEKMPVLKYRIPLSGTNDVEIRYLEPENLPVLNEAGEVEFIIHSFTDVTARELEHKEIKERCERFQRLMDLSADLICTFDEKGRFISVNAASAAIWGYTPEELIGKSVFDYTQPTDLQKSLDLLADLLSGKEAYNFEKSYIHKSGKRVSVYWSLRYDPVKKLIYGIGRDASSIKQVENQLNSYSHLISNILESITDAFVTVDKNWMVTYWNKEAEHIFKKSRASIVGKNLWEVFPEAIPTKFFTEYHQAMAEQVSVHFQQHYAPVNRWFDCSAYPFKDGLTIYLKDITTRKQAEEEIWIANERYEKASKATNDIIFDMDVNTYTIAWNSAYKLVLGYDDTETPLDVCNKKVHPEDQARVLEKVQNAVEQSKEYWVDEYRYKTIDGSYKHLLVRGYLIYDDQQKPVRMIGAMQDVTEQKLHELELKELNQQLQARAEELQNYSTRIENILESITDGFFALDKDWKITYCNKNAEKIAGINRQELIGKNLQELYTDESSLQIFAYYTKALEENTSVHFQSFSALYNRWFDISAYPSELGLSVYFKDITEKKLAEEQIWIANERFEKVAKATKDIVWDLNLKSGTIEWSSAFCTVLGFDVQETSIEFWYDHIHPQDQERVKKNFEGHTFSPQQIWTEEYRFRCADGSYKYLIDRGYQIFDDSNNAVRMVGAMQDITDRKQYELELEELNRQLDRRAKEIAASKIQLEDYTQKIENILESITDGFIAVDRNWLITYWNKAAEQILGSARSNSIGKNLWHVFHDAIDSKSYWEYHRAMAENISVHFQEYYPTVSKWFDVSAYPSELGLSVYFKDITEKKLAEEQIWIANERYEKVAKATNDILWDMDIKTRKIIWSNAYTNVLGYEALESHLSDCYDRIHPEDQEKALSQLETCIQHSIEHWSQEYRYRCADGTYKYLHNRAFLIHDDQQQPVRMIGAMQDITERKQYELSLQELNAQLQKRAEELAASNKELEQFAYIVSHDLQEPLRMVTSFMAQLERKYKSQLDEKAGQYIHFAVDGAVRMRKLIQDLLEYSRVGRDTSFDLVDLETVMKEVMQLNRTLIEEKRAVIAWDNLPQVYASKTGLMQVLQNLIGNALKYHEPEKQPMVKISATEHADYWQFAVTDNGIGMEPQYFQRIFQIFQRLHQRSEYSGTGIGLAICKKVIEQHKGEIWVKSVPEKGSTFYFTIHKQL